jgi:L-lactate dehydrogenase complex protein LldG
MNSREKILAAIRQNQPDLKPLPSLEGLNQSTHVPKEQFQAVLQSIGGMVVEVGDYQEIERFVQQNYSPENRIITTLTELKNVAGMDWQNSDPHDLENVELAIIKAHFGVPTMHEAYARIGSADYGFGAFIAGPSKTADIEQSLVLGAHGSKTMVVFLMKNTEGS